MAHLPQAFDALQFVPLPLNGKIILIFKGRV